MKKSQRRGFSDFLSRSSDECSVLGCSWEVPEIVTKNEKISHWRITNNNAQGAEGYSGLQDVNFSSKLCFRNLLIKVQWCFSWEIYISHRDSRKKASNLLQGDHVTSRDNDVVLWTCCVTELIVSNALGENFLLSDCKHINVICMTKRPSKHDHEIGSHNKGLTWFLNLRENTPYGIKILWGFQTNPCLPGPPQTQLRNIKLTTLIPYIRGISAWGSVNKLQSVPMQKPILLLCSNSFFSSRSAHRTWRIKEGQIIKAVV